LVFRDASTGEEGEAPVASALADAAVLIAVVIAIGRCAVKIKAKKWRKSGWRWRWVETGDRDQFSSAGRACFGAGVESVSSRR
jgi:hypothetical protein